LLTLDDAGLGIHRPDANTMAFMTGSAERMRLTSAGRLGIGTNNPQTLVEISSASVPNLRIHNTAGGAVRIDLMRAGTGTVGLDWRIHNPNGVLVFGRSTDDLSTVTDHYQFSDVRFRPTSNDELALGQSIFRWTTLFCTNPVNVSSDARLKTDIHPLQYGLNEVMKMQPVSYRWKKDDAPEKMLGFLAQDMLGIIPEAVTTGATNDEMMGMAYTELIPVLAKAIQELKEENEALRQQQEVIEGMKATMGELKTAIEILKRKPN
ncbi:MAG TPA: tail fiber domain-containing protein, partial [Phnomibacter sp.]|nr:tail fiber domain-containing protein [Phnomibacter sp.]